MADEEWLVIPNAPGYEVSSLRRVRNSRSGRVLKTNDKGQVFIGFPGRLGRWSVRALWMIADNERRGEEVERGDLADDI